MNDGSRWPDDIDTAGSALSCVGDDLFCRWPDMAGRDPQNSTKVNKNHLVCDDFFIVCGGVYSEHLPQVRGFADLF